jgi:hypothetical protein
MFARRNFKMVPGNPHYLTLLVSIYLENKFNK